jgi:hypothetical protein
LGIASPTSAREGRLRPPLFIKGVVAVSTALCANLLQYLHEQVFDFVRPYSGDGAEVGFLATILACLNFAARKYGETDRPPCGAAAKRIHNPEVQLHGGILAWIWFPRRCPTSPRSDHHWLHRQLVGHPQRATSYRPRYPPASQRLSNRQRLFAALVLSSLLRDPWRPRLGTARLFSPRLGGLNCHPQWLQ